MEMVIDGAAAAEKKPRLAVLPSPGMGHLTPLLEFAKRLVIHRGFCISFLIIITSVPPSPYQEKLLSSANLPSDLHVVRLPPVDLAAVDKRLLARLFRIIRESFKSLNHVLVAELILDVVQLPHYLWSITREWGVTTSSTEHHV